MLVGREIADREQNETEHLGKISMGSTIPQPRPAEYRQQSSSQELWTCLDRSAITYMVSTAGRRRIEYREA